MPRFAAPGLRQRRRRRRCWRHSVRSAGGLHEGRAGPDGDGVGRSQPSRAHGQTRKVPTSLTITPRPRGPTLYCCFFHLFGGGLLASPSLPPLLLRRRRSQISVDTHLLPFSVTLAAPAGVSLTREMIDMCAGCIHEQSCGKLGFLGFFGGSPRVQSRTGASPGVAGSGSDRRTIVVYREQAPSVSAGALSDGEGGNGCGVVAFW